MSGVDKDSRVEMPGILAPGQAGVVFEQYGWFARHLNSVRHHVDHDAHRFICQTHQDIPPQPPRRRGALVLFAHYDPHGIVDPYVVYYLQALHRLGTTIVFISGSPSLTPESVAPLRSICAGIYTRRTLSLDFGSWHLGWNILRAHGWSLDQFDRLVLANDSVYGPLFPLEEMWDSFQDADMYGSIESLEQGPHLQSFFLAWDLNSRTRPFLNDFWENFRYTVNKNRLIQRCEIGLSRRAHKARLRIKPFVSADAIRDAQKRVPDHQWSQKFAEPQVNNSLYFYDGLIKHLRYPFIKTVLPRTGSPQHDSLKHLRAFIEENTTYPYALVQFNLNRLGCDATTESPRLVNAPPSPGF
ncbi:rhamnan synthesis F family protein [Mycobacterium sp. Root265]|uniref:rhamnan synthesis F family protein n=1 Tax=Mycobacterium sp. Root265 TaxID=1736504 RepID=UPI0009E8481A|nr:rhamnan synthesis F family protein [Mycobacterium sp. Root265]